MSHPVATPPRVSPPRVSPADLGQLERDLRARVDGEVRFDEGSRAAYSADGSNFRQVPYAVVLPRTLEAAAEAIRCCRDHGVPLLHTPLPRSLRGEAHFRHLEWFHDHVRLERMLFDGCAELLDGQAPLPGAPGHGLALKPDAERYRVA